MHSAILALGTNLYDKEDNIKKAIRAIGCLPKTSVVKISSLYETKPFLVPDKQGNFLNCCIEVETDLQPKTLLGCCLGIEASMGRRRPYKNAARIIDIDLLLYEDRTYEDSDLFLPHPRIKERAFVMIPLLDICSEGRFFDFDFNKEIQEIDCSDVKKYDKNFLFEKK